MNTASKGMFPSEIKRFSSTYYVMTIYYGDHFVTIILKQAVAPQAQETLDDVFSGCFRDAKNLPPVVLISISKQSSHEPPLPC